MVVNTAPVSSTKRPPVVPSGPVTSAVTMIRSPSIANGVSCLVIEDEGWARRSYGNAASEVVSDHLVMRSPAKRLIDRCATRLSMTDDARGAKFQVEWMHAIDLDKAHPFVGMSRTDLGPRQRLGDLRRQLLCSVHDPMVVREKAVSSFRQTGGACLRLDQSISAIRAASSGASLARSAGSHAAARASRARSMRGEACATRAAGSASTMPVHTSSARS